MRNTPNIFTNGHSIQVRINVVSHNVRHNSASITKVLKSGQISYMFRFEIEARLAKLILGVDLLYFANWQEFFS